MTERSGSPAASSRRSVRLVASVAAVGLASTAIVAAGGGTAAAAGLPNAQSVGRFVDGSVGGNPIQSLADVKDARATAPGSTSVQNPLEVKLLNAINLPLTNLINIPTAPAVDAGAVNQVASANLNGASKGASGAVLDDGGANLGDSGTDTSFAKIKLDATALGGSGLSIPGIPSTVPGLPAGGGTEAALGGITATLGAVYANVGTRKGGRVITPQSGIANLDLSIGSPALGALIKQLKTLLSSAALGGIALPGGAPALPSGCALTSPTFGTLTLTKGVTLDVENATLKISLGDLVEAVLGKDISNLDTSNFDLVSFLVKKLPTILSDGIGGIVTTLTTSLATQFKACTDLINNIPIAGTITSALLKSVVDALLGGQTTLTSTLSGLARTFEANDALGTLADGLKNIIDIGLNVQSGPGIEPREKTYDYESNLEATPNQSTPVVEDQTVVRAIEINLLNAAAVPNGLPNLPGLNSAKVTQLAGKTTVRPLALAPGDGVANVALGNAAAGPSDVSNATVVPTSSTPSIVPTTNIPTAIPAGQAGGGHDGGLPVLPLVAILMLMMVSGGAFWQYRMRGLNEH